MLDILKEEKSKFVSLVVWSFLLSIVNGALLLILGPVLRSFFSEYKHGETIEISKMLSEWSAVLPDRKIFVEYSYMVLAVPVVLAVIAIIRSAVLYFFLVSQDRFALRYTNKYRVKLFRTIMSLPFSKLSEKSSAEWMSYLINDVQFLQTRISEMLKVSIRETTMILGIIAGLLIVDFKITMILIALTLPLSFYGYKLGKKISKFTKISQNILAELTGVVSHLRRTFWYFKTQSGEETEKAGFSEFNKSYFEAMKNTILARSILTPGLELMGTAALCSVLIYFQFFSSEPQPEYMFQVILSMGLIMKPLRSLGDQLAKYGELKGALNHTFDAIIEVHKLEQDSIDDKKSDQSENQINFPVEISNISFERNKKLIFSAENLEIRSGETIAIVGPSGAGKSSFMKAMAGLYKPSKFSSKTSIEQLSSSTSYVSQHPFFFNGKVKENLSYLNESSDVEKITDTILHDLGLDSKALMNKEIETGSKEISQGQLQRLTIARGLLRDKKIYLFDEASSALDQESEKKVVNQIHEFSKNRNISCLWITHRLELLSEFDRIWFINEGKITELDKNNLDILKGTVL